MLEALIFESDQSLSAVLQQRCAALRASHFANKCLQGSKAYRQPLFSCVFRSLTAITVQTPSALRECARFVGPGHLLRPCASGFEFGVRSGTSFCAQVGRLRRPRLRLGLPGEADLESLFWARLGWSLIARNFEFVVARMRPSGLPFKVITKWLKKV